MQLGVGVFGDRPLTQVQAYVARAEEMGFRSAWVADHYCLREMFTTMTALGLSTRRLRIASGTANPYTRHVATYAMGFATLQELIGDRIIFGIGAAVRPQRQLLGKNIQKNFAMIRESIEVFRRLLAGGPVNFSGEIVNVAGLKLGFNSGITVPIYLGAIGEKMVRLAGEVCDGILLTGGTSIGYAKAAVEWILEGARSAGRKPEALQTSSYVITAVSDDPRQARDSVKEWVLTFLSQPFFRPLARVSGIDESDVDRLRRMVESSGVKEAADKVPEYIVRTLTAAGSVRECVEWLAALHESGVEEAVIVPLGRDPAKTITDLGREFSHG